MGKQAQWQEWASRHNVNVARLEPAMEDKAEDMCKAEEANGAEEYEDGTESMFNGACTPWFGEKGRPWIEGSG